MIELMIVRSYRMVEASGVGDEILVKVSSGKTGSLSRLIPSNACRGPSPTTILKFNVFIPFTEFIFEGMWLDNCHRTSNYPPPKIFTESMA